MDSTAIGLGVLSSMTALAAAAISARANRNAAAGRRVGHANAEALERLSAMGDRRQARLIRSAAEAVAKEHPELLASAVADELVRTVLEAILEGHLEQTDLQQRRAGEPNR